MARPSGACTTFAAASLVRSVFAIVHGRLPPGLCGPLSVYPPVPAGFPVTAPSLGIPPFTPPADMASLLRLFLSFLLLFAGQALSPPPVEAQTVPASDSPIADTLGSVLVVVLGNGVPLEGTRVEVISLQFPSGDTLLGPGLAALARLGGEPGGSRLALEARTDARGEARLSLPAGVARLRVERTGFVSASLEVEVRGGEEVRLSASLEVETVVLEGLVVGVTRTGRRVQDEPLRVEVLDREEIEEKMLMAPGSIVMLLNETGGLRVQTTSPALGSANIRVQGMRGRYTQLLADGLPLYGGQAGAIGLLQIPPVDLGQVEVVKGVASALHGGSALGGIVNLVSRRPDDDEAEGEWLLNATSRGGQDVTTYLATPFGEGAWSGSLTGSVHRQEARDLDGSRWADLAGYRRAGLRPRLFRETAEGSSLLLTAGGMVETREGGTLPGAQLPSGIPFPETLDTRRFDAGLSAQHPLGGGRFLQLRASGMRQDHDHRFGAVDESDRHATAFAEAALAGGAGTHAWIWGVAVQRDQFRSETFPDFDYSFTVPALFGQHELRPLKDVTVSASARLDWHTTYGNQVSPRVSALYRPGAWTFRGSVGGGFFAPTPFVEEIEAAGLSRLAPLEGLRAERARTGSVDAGRLLGPLEVNATLFASRVRDAVQLVPVGPSMAPDASGSPGADPPGVRLVNVPGETRTGGIEALVRYRRDDLSVTANYVFVEASEPTGSAGGRRAIPLTPRHTAGLVAMWEDHDRGLLGVEAYYTGRQELDDNPFRDRARPHLHLGVLGEVRRERWSIFLNLENLLNVRQTRTDPLLRPSPAPDGRWTVDAWAPLDGFTLNGGIRIWLGTSHGHHD